MPKYDSSRVDFAPWGRSAPGARVLVENPDRAVRWAYVGLLRSAGYDVRTCEGPEDHEGEPVGCPLLEGSPCPLVEGADVVVSSCDLAHSRDVLARLVSNGGTPVVFEAPAPAFDRYRDVAGASILLPDPVTEGRLLAAVADARARH